MLPLEHPITLAVVGPMAGDFAARLSGRLGAHQLPRSFASLEDLAAAAHASRISIAAVLPAALDDDIRNFAPGDLYVKVRPERPAAALSRDRYSQVAVALVGWDSFDPAARPRDPADRCQRLMLAPSAVAGQAIGALNSGNCDSIVIADTADAEEAVVREIKRLTQCYFAFATLFLREVLTVNGADVLDDPQAGALLAQAKAELGAESHIIVADPPGALIGRGGEAVAFLLLARPGYCDAVRELAAERNASEPSPSGFAEAGAQAEWAEIVSRASDAAGMSNLVSARIDRTYGTAPLFDQILAGGRL